MKGKKILPFAQDIAEPLCESIEGKFPASISLKNLAKYVDDDLAKESNVLMVLIEKEIESRIDTSKTRAMALREVWSEMITMINKNEKTASKISRGVSMGLSALVGATLWTKLDFDALLYAVVARQILKKETTNLSESIGDKAMKLISTKIQPKYVCLFSDYQANLRKKMPKYYLS